MNFKNFFKKESPKESFNKRMGKALRLMGKLSWQVEKLENKENIELRQISNYKGEQGFCFYQGEEAVSEVVVVDSDLTNEIWKAMGER